MYHSRESVSSLNKELGIDKEKVLIHVSNFREVKRVPDIVRVFEQSESRNASEAFIVGDGPEMSSVCDLVDSITVGLEQDVLFLGKQENLEELYNISDLMLLLSEKESFGLVLLEAMACGVPCHRHKYWRHS